MLESRDPVPVFKALLLSVDVFISRTPGTFREKCKQRNKKQKNQNLNELQSNSNITRVTVALTTARL